MRRKAVIQHLPPSRTPQGVYPELRKTWHLHFCRERDCRTVYDDYRCDDVSVNGHCHHHRGRQRPVWDMTRDPQPCCYGNTYQVVSTDELVRQRLAGPGPWFKCRTCARSHGWPCNDPNERNA